MKDNIAILNDTKSADKKVFFPNLAQASYLKSACFGMI